jgi:hypothetical protein
MASIDSVTYDQPSYPPGAPVTLTIDYTPDSPAVVPTTVDVTVTLSDASGNQLASVPAPFVVNIPQPSGDTLGVADDHSDTWASQSDTGTVAVWATTAPSA